MLITTLPSRLAYLSSALIFALACPTAAETSLQTSDGAIDIASWGYQLQGPPPDGELLPGPLNAAPHDLLVIDFARFGDEDSKFTTAEITAINNRSGNVLGRRVTAAYVSIGEASEFRSYWDKGWTTDGAANSALSVSAPTWLGPVNPDFIESRKVRYWDSDWQTLIYNDAKTGWLDQVVKQGFDAAYLDIIDAYYFWGEEAAAVQKTTGDPVDTQDAARRMIDFVTEMTAHARQTQPDFFVVPQNGAFIMNDADFAGALAEDPVRRAAYLDAIGGIGIEDLYNGGDNDEDNPFDPDTDKIQVLKDDFLANGKTVFVVEYLTDPALIQQFITQAQADGFIPYVAPSRDLDVLAEPIPEPTSAIGLLLGTLAFTRRTRR